MEGPLGAPDSMPVEYVSVRRMALAVENFDPIHYDAEAAKARGFRGVVAPWPLLWLIFFNCRDAPLQFTFGKATLHGQDRYEFHEPMIVGDVITVSASVSETSVKQGKSGLMGVVVTRTGISQSAWDTALRCDVDHQPAPLIPSFDARRIPIKLAQSSRSTNMKSLPLAAVLLAACAAVAPLSASAQTAATFPSKPIRLVVPFPPGGSVGSARRA